ncbi:hypothetical protein IKF94_01675 [Candidatus Saccharibacteria bacterium]|nr:hypothetical protein [Candidatus Saccharibacteria bacterium]
MTEQINVMELYKLYQMNPASFSAILENLFSHEIYVILESIVETIKFIEDEDGKDERRNRYIYEQIEETATVMESVFKSASFFRKMEIKDGVTGEDLREFMHPWIALTRAAKGKSEAEIKREGQEAFPNAKSFALGILDTVRKQFVELDKDFLYLKKWKKPASPEDFE